MPTKLVRRMEPCGHCDGDGFSYYCDDYLEGQCITGWDMPCDSCKGKGFIWTTVALPDPKWARMWKQINADGATS